MKRRCPSAKTTSKARDDFPEPLGPVTTVSAPCGTLAEISLRLCSRARSTVIASIGGGSAASRAPGVPLAREARWCAHRDGGLRPAARDLRRRAGEDDPSAVGAAAGPEIDDPVGLADHVEIVLHDDDARPLVDELMERAGRRTRRPRRGGRRSARR